VLDSKAHCNASVSNEFGVWLLNTLRSDEKEWYEDYFCDDGCVGVSARAWLGECLRSKPEFAFLLEARLGG
jgi:hypothetical protein